LKIYITCITVFVIYRNQKKPYLTPYYVLRIRLSLKWMRVGGSTCISKFLLKYVQVLKVVHWSIFLQTILLKQNYTRYSFHSKILHFFFSEPSGSVAKLGAKYWRRFLCWPRRWRWGRGYGPDPARCDPTGFNHRRNPGCHRSGKTLPKLFYKLI